MQRRLHVHALVDSLGAGGAELLLAEFAAVAPEAGIELSVAALRGDSDSPAAVRLRAADIEPAIVPVRSLLGRRDRRRVRDHLRATAPDVVHTHLGYADVLGGLAARDLGLPALSTIHADWWARDPRERAKTALMAHVRRRCAARVIAVSEAARRAYLARGWDRPERVVVVHNGVAPLARPGSGIAVRAELGLEPDDLLLTMVSRLGYEKAHDVAIDAVAHLRDRAPRVRLAIAGDGELREAIERRAAPLGDAVLVLGHREDVAELLDATDVLIQPSRFDAFPTTLLEAMAASVPVVATAVGGMVEIVVDGETGVLFDPPPTATALTSALTPLLADRDLRRRLGAAGHRRLRQAFDPVLWAKRTRAIYELALGCDAASLPLAHSP